MENFPYFMCTSLLCSLERIKDVELVEVGVGRPIYCLTGQAFISYGEHRTTRNTFILAVHHKDESNYIESELKLIRVQTNKLTLILSSSGSAGCRVLERCQQEVRTS